MSRIVITGANRGIGLELARARHEIHEVIRQGYTVVCVERRGTGWRVRFSGPRSMSSIISIDVGREASVA